MVIEIAAARCVGVATRVTRFGRACALAAGFALAAVASAGGQTESAPAGGRPSEAAPRETRSDSEDGTRAGAAPDMNAAATIAGGSQHGAAQPIEADARRGGRAAESDRRADSRPLVAQEGARIGGSAGPRPSRATGGFAEIPPPTLDDRSMPIVDSELPTPHPHNRPWWFHDYLADADLTDATVFAIEEDGAGGIWVGSTKGLSHFDGIRWEAFGVRSGLPSVHVHSLERTRDGALWIGTDCGAGVFDREDSSFDPHALCESVCGGRVTRIRQAADGALWFCSDTGPDDSGAGGLTCIENGEIRRWTRANGLPGDSVRDLLFASDGRVFASTGSGLARIEPTSAARLPELEALIGVGTPIHDWVEAPFGLVVATAEGIFVERSGTWRALPTPPFDGVRTALVATGDGHAFGWVGDDQPRLLEIREREVVPMQSRTLVAGGEVLGLEELSSGDVWAFGEGLLTRWERIGGAWTLYSSCPPVRFEAPDASVWFADDDRVLRYGADGFERIAGACAPIAPAADGAIWMGGAGCVLRWRNGRTQEVLRFPSERDRLVGIRFDPEGRAHLLEHSRSGARLHVETDQAWRTIPVLPSPRGERSHLVAADDGGRSWLLRSDRFGRAVRLEFFEDEHWHPIEPPAELHTRGPLDVHVDADGTAWIYGSSGLFRCVDERAGSWRREHGLPGLEVLDLIETANGIHAITSTAAGGRSAFCTRLAEDRWKVVDAYLGRIVGRDGDRALFDSRPDGVLVFDLEDPAGHRLVPLQVQARASHAVRDRSGRMWFSTDTRLGVLRPDGRPPHLALLEAPSRVSIGEEIHVHVEALEPFLPRADATPVTVRYRMDDGEWRLTRARPEANMTFDPLPPGPHALWLCATDPSGETTTNALVHRFEVLPTPLQERAWFWPLIGALFVAISVLAATSLVGRAQLRAQAGELERRVEDRTRELRTSERRYRHLFEASHDSILLLDAEGRTVEANAAARELLGKLEVPPASFPAQVVGEESRRAVEARLRDESPDGELEVELELPDGRRLDVLLGISRRSVDVWGPGHQVVVRDIGAQKRTERERESLIAELERKNDELQRFTYSVSHDLRSPLVTIRGFVDVMVEDALKGDHDQLREDAQFVYRASDHMQALLGDLLELSRIDHAPAEKVVLDPRELIQEAATLVGERLSARGVAWRIEGHTRTVLGNRVRLVDLFLNLFDNAAKFMGDQPEPRVVARLSDEGDEVRIDVIDNGKGIEPSDQRRVFELFEKLDAGEEGTGVGLALVQRIVEMHAGRVEALSDGAGTGTTMRVHLPVCESVS